MSVRNIYLNMYTYLFLIIIYILRTFFHYNQADSVLPHSTSYPLPSTKKGVRVELSKVCLPLI
jgi:hypothetical protein